MQINIGHPLVWCGVPSIPALAGCRGAGDFASPTRCVSWKLTLSDSSARVPASALMLSLSLHDALPIFMPDVASQLLHARGAIGHERSVSFPAAASATATRYP